MRNVTVQAIFGLSLLLLAAGSSACAGNGASEPAPGSTLEDEADAETAGGSPGASGDGDETTRSDAGGDGDRGDGDVGDGDGEPAAPASCAGVQCSTRQFCNYADAACGAADVASGQCQTRPSACSLIYRPVCGCDGKTYASDCAANVEGTSVRSEGECPKAAAGKTCGGWSGNTCTADEFCDYALEAGGTGCASIPADGSGVCVVKPAGCNKILAEVCGCDGKTYGNECTAHAGGVSVLHTGACKN